MATKWQRSHRAKPTLDAVLANVTPGRSHRLHLGAEQKQKLGDADGRLARQVIRALLRAREHPSPRDSREASSRQPSTPSSASPASSDTQSGRSAPVIARALDAGIIREAGSYRQAYRITGPSGHRVKLYEIAVRVSARVDGLRSALRLQRAFGKRGSVKRLPARGDGERAGDVRTVRAAADLSADSGGARREEGARRSGGKAGATLPAKVVKRIQRERAAGKSFAAIADRLNADRVPTAQGGRLWYPATVHYVASRGTVQARASST